MPRFPRLGNADNEGSYLIGCARVRRVSTRKVWGTELGAHVVKILLFAASAGLEAMDLQRGGLGPGCCPPPQEPLWLLGPSPADCGAPRPSSPPRSVPGAGLGAARALLFFHHCCVL